MGKGHQYGTGLNTYQAKLRTVQLQMLLMISITSKKDTILIFYQCYLLTLHIYTRTIVAICRFEEDAKLMNYLGIRNFRMSISWPRIFPTGRPPLNQPGIDFYKRVIKTLRDNCIEPHLTLYHWDLPLTLYEEYGGWIDPRIEDDFVVYAETVWTHLKDDVQYWTTFNEPETFCVVGYEIGIHAPGRCSDRSKCPEGNSTTEGWKCAYHVINAHAKAERVFRKVVPNGKLGINLSMGYMIPSTDSEEDKVRGT